MSEPDFWSNKDRAQQQVEEVSVLRGKVAPLLVLNGSGLASLVYDFVIERIERLKLRHTMSLYFSPRD